MYSLNVKIASDISFQDIKIAYNIPFLKILKLLVIYPSLNAKIMQNIKIT